MSCDLYTLWQWFGCGAWDPTLEGTALLLVEPKYLDRNWQKKEENRQKCQLVKKNTENKWKATSSTGVGEPAVKRQCTTVGGMTDMAVVVEVTSSGAASGSSSGEMVAVVPTAQSESCQTRESLNAERASTYSQQVMRNGQKVKHTGNELSPAEDDFVNAATRYFRCYRGPVMLYFGNKQLSMAHSECFSGFHTM